MRSTHILKSSDKCLRRLLAEAGSLIISGVLYPLFMGRYKYHISVEYMGSLEFEIPRRHGAVLLHLKAVLYRSKPRSAQKFINAAFPEVVVNPPYLS